MAVDTNIDTNIDTSPISAATALQPDEHRSVLIIGAGTSGILQACALLRHPTHPIPRTEFALLDRYSDFGGCWWKNTYPGCACDTPSHIYSVSWYRNPNWSRKYAPQAEIQAYYRRLADEYKLRQTTHFQTEVVRASWVEELMLWAVETRHAETGLRKIWTATVLVTALGPFSVPKKLNIPGIEEFAGRQWHAAEWPSDADVRGKRVAVIGTGPSSGQIIPAIHKDVKSMVVYQRSPGHCWPRKDFEFKGLWKWVFAMFPFVLNFYVWYLLQLQEVIFYRMCKKSNWLQRRAFAISHAHLDSQVSDPVLHSKLKSTDDFGCKRPLFLDDYYPTLSAPNVSLITDPVLGLTKTSVLSSSSSSSSSPSSEKDKPPTATPIDVLIWGTGYAMSRPGSNFPLHGRHGQLLADAYTDNCYNLYGIAKAGFPNLLNFVGPYSVSIWFSIVLGIEAMATHHAEVVRKVLDLNRGSFRRAVMPRGEREREWVQGLRVAQRELPTSDETCVTYYKNPQGRVVAYPGSAAEYRKLLKTVRWGEDWEMVEWRPGMEGGVRVGDVLD